jgi:hypothetical protein
MKGKQQEQRRDLAYRDGDKTIVRSSPEALTLVALLRTIRLPSKTEGKQS